MNFNQIYLNKSNFSKRLPLKLIALNEWALVSVTGEDSEKYLHSQVTANVIKMKSYQHIITAHCNSKGKVWSILHLFRRGNGFSFIERRSVLSIQLNEMKKYAIFSKINLIHEDDIILIGIIGSQSRTVLKYFFNELPNKRKPLINKDTTSILWFEYPLERFLIATDKLTANIITTNLYCKSYLSNNQQWLALNIESGIPIIDYENIEKFTPQSVNINILGGISFRKGCYIGQEIIAKTEFRGINKLTLFYLSGSADRIPKTGEQLQMKLGNNWRNTGIILASAKIDENKLVVQAVMNNNIKKDSVFRINDDNGILFIKSLPY